MLLNIYIRLDKILCSFRQNFPFLFSVTEKALKTESKTEIEQKVEKEGNFGGKLI